jgi:4-cresol dehydrogenase (hydroxylating)
MTSNTSAEPDSSASAFLTSLAHLLGPEKVLEGSEAQRRYGINTDQQQQRIAGAVLLASTEEVVQTLEAANRHRVPLYPISRGRNWGYASANPPSPGCVIVDLSGMNRILACDPELGTVTLQPGVTQQLLKAYLDDNRLDFLVPVHGGGPGCSLVGNALERGYGITPISDHFAAVQSLAAVLPNGEVYRASLHAAGAETAARGFKWGVGPYLDGLFTQSNFGIVTEMTIALARRPRRIEMFYFWVQDDALLERTVVQVREVLRRFSGVVGSINLMNDRRILSMAAPFPRESVSPGGIVPGEVVQELRTRYDISAWTGIGAMYGDARVVQAARAGVKALLKPVARRLIFLSTPKARRLRWLLGLLPRKWVGKLVKSLDLVLEGQKVLEGHPTELALRLAYWRSGRTVPVGDINPARDGCGLLWYAPLVPMRPETVRNFVTTVNEVCTRHGVEPLITFTSLSERCYDSTVPILFDPSNADETQRAHLCYTDLLAAARAFGCFPYRFGADHMEHVVDPEVPFWRLVTTLKHAVDPNHILAPGRYACPPDTYTR